MDPLCERAASLTMSIVYFRSSAVVKLVVEEEGSELAAAGRGDRLDRAAQGRAEMAWEVFWAATRTIELSEPITAHAGQPTRFARRRRRRSQCRAVSVARANLLSRGPRLRRDWDRATRF